LYARKQILNHSKDIITLLKAFSEMTELKVKLFIVLKEKV